MPAKDSTHESVDGQQKLPCPHCGELTSSEKTACEHCQKDFPWTKEVKRLEGMIKVRETSRLRAATTFLKDYQKSRKTGEPIPFESMRGLLNAWLFRSGAIFVAVGAIITSLVALAQLALLWRQENIMDRQTDLMLNQNKIEAFDYLIAIKDILSEKPISLEGKPMNDFTGKKDSMIAYWPLAPEDDIELVVSLWKITDKPHKKDKKDNKGKTKKGLVEEILYSLLDQKNVSLSAGALFALLEIKKKGNPNAMLNLENYFVNMKKADLRNYPLKNIKFGEVSFNNAKFGEYTIESIELTETVTFYNAVFESTTIKGCKLLNHAAFEDVLFLNTVKIESCKLEDTKFHNCIFENVTLENNAISKGTLFKNCQYWGSSTSLQKLYAKNIDSSEWILTDKDSINMDTAYYKNLSVIRYDAHEFEDSLKIEKDRRNPLKSQ